MKTLSKLMMSEFIELSCGHIDVVLEKGEKVSEQILKDHVHKLMVEYKMIVNESGMKTVIAERSSELHRKGKWQLLKNCMVLLTLGALDDVKSILAGIGLNYRNAPSSVIEAKVKSEMRRLEFEQSRMENVKKEEKELPDEKDIRSEFDRELASMMLFFKMSIDIHSVTAAVYANMVRQAVREMNETKRAVQSMRR